MAELSQEELESYDRSLVQLIQSEGGSPELPNLVREESKLAEYIQQYWKKVQDWLFSFFDFKLDDNTNLSTDFLPWLSSLLYILFYTGLTVLFIVFCFWVYKKCKKKKKISPSFKVKHQALYIKKTQAKRKFEGGALEEIQQLVNLQEFQKACRLRWKLFLKRLHEKPFLTPDEWKEACLAKNRLGPSFLKKIDVFQKLNPMMFDQLSHTIEHYNDFDQYLSSLEIEYLNKA